MKGSSTTKFYSVETMDISDEGCCSPFHVEAQIKFFQEALRSNTSLRSLFPVAAFCLGHLGALVPGNRSAVLGRDLERLSSINSSGDITSVFPPLSIAPWARPRTWARSHQSTSCWARRDTLSWAQRSKSPWAHCDTPDSDSDHDNDDDDDDLPGWRWTEGRWSTAGLGHQHKPKHLLWQWLCFKM